MDKSGSKVVQCGSKWFKGVQNFLKGVPMWIQSLLKQFKVMWLKVVLIGSKGFKGVQDGV